MRRQPRGAAYSQPLRRRQGQKSLAAPAKPVDTFMASAPTPRISGAGVQLPGCGLGVRCSPHHGRHPRCAGPPVGRRTPHSQGKAVVVPFPRRAHPRRTHNPPAARASHTLTTASTSTLKVGSAMAASTIVLLLAASAATTTREPRALAAPAARRLLRAVCAAAERRGAPHTAFTAERRAAAMVRGAAKAGACGWARGRVRRTCWGGYPMRHKRRTHSGHHGGRHIV